MSGILGIVLNILLIPKYSLIGVGIATLSANLLYLLLSLFIVIPGLGFRFPKDIMLKILFALIPYCFFVFLVKLLMLPAALKMLVLLFVFHSAYWLVGRVMSQD